MIDVANAQRLGLNGSNLSVSNPNIQADNAARAAIGVSTPQPAPVIAPAPVSPLTSKPVTFGTSTTGTTMPSPAVDVNYQLQPGESVDAYNRRITAYRDSRGASPTASGGYVATDGSGNAVSSPNFSIDTSGAIPSSVLGSSYSMNDVTNTHKTYADYVNGLAQAQQYSPAYLDALNASNAAKLHGSELTSNYYTGNNLPGDTQGYAQGFTTREGALNDVRSLAATNALQVQELVRQGNIAGAKALVDANAPQSVSPGSSLVNPVTGDQTYAGLGGYQAVQAIQTVSNLAQTYPDANIQPTDSLEQAQMKAAAAPSFTSKNLVQVTLPGGGIQFVNRNQLQTNSDGTYTLVGSGDATTQSAASTAIKSLTQQKANVQSAIATADKNFPLLIQAAKAAGVNNNAPLFNQLQQAFARKAINSSQLAVLQTLVPSLQTEYSRILARGGGATTVDERQTSQALIDGTYSVKQLQAVYDTVKKESSNVIAGYDDAISQQQQALGGGSTGTGKYAF